MFVAFRPFIKYIFEGNNDLSLKVNNGNAGFTGGVWFDWRFLFACFDNVQRSYIYPFVFKCYEFNFSSTVPQILFLIYSLSFGKLVNHGVSYYNIA